MKQQIELFLMIGIEKLSNCRGFLEKIAKHLAYHRSDHSEFLNVYVKTILWAFGQSGNELLVSEEQELPEMDTILTATDEEKQAAVIFFKNNMLDYLDKQTIDFLRDVFTTNNEDKENETLPINS